MAGDSIKFNASLNTAAFESGAKKLQGVAAGAASGISQHFGKIAMAVAGIGAAFLGIRAAVQSFNAAIAMGGALNDLSARTGETAGNLAILQRAFQNAGAGAEAVGPTINRLQRAIVEAGEGGKQQAQAFAKLGLNLQEIKSKTPTEQLEAVAVALQGVGNDSDRGAIAMQLLGRSGGELLPLLRAMGVELDIARGQLGSLPGVIDRTNKHLDQIGDNFAAIGEKGKEFMVGLLEKLAPGLADLTDRLANIDAAGFGAKLSEYAERTAAWISQTFKLGDALNNLEVAIKGITSGNFGDGLSLMFMTARDTALNAINNIVAAAGAALQTVGAAIGKLFDPSSTTMAFIEGSFQMLGAKIASGIFDAIATVLEKLPFMGAASAAVREAQKEAEQAIKDISNIMYYEADNLKSEWGGIMAEMPKEFAAAYRQKMERPLFEMKDRTTETAEQMERVARATRAAAFDAEKFGKALRDAQVDRLAGQMESGGLMAGQNPGGKKFPWQGAGPSGAPIAAGGGANLGGGGGRVDGGGSIAAPSALDLLRERGREPVGGSRVDENIDDRLARIRGQAEEMQVRNRRDNSEARAKELGDRGMYNSAAAERERGKRREERDAERIADRKRATDRYGGNNEAEAYRNYREQMANNGVYAGDVSPEDFKNWLREQEKSDREREREAKRGGEDRVGAGGATNTDSMGSIEQLVRRLKEYIVDEKNLPQHALC
jgi:hypothetical protein